MDGFSEPVEGEVTMKVIGSVVICVLLLCACRPAENRGWIELTVDGSSYRLDWATLMVQPLGDGQIFFSLDQDPLRVRITRAVPGGAIQWRMPLDDVSRLQGMTIDLGNPDFEGLVSFDLYDDVGVMTLEPDPRVRIRFESVDRGLAEGRFEGDGFFLIDGEGADLGGVNLEGRFRAVIQLP